MFVCDIGNQKIQLTKYRVAFLYNWIGGGENVAFCSVGVHVCLWVWKCLLLLLFFKVLLTREMIKKDVQYVFHVLVWITGEYGSGYCCQIFY